MPVNPLANYKTTLLGGVPGAVLVDDAIRDVAQQPDSWTSWVRLVIGLLSIIAGALARDAQPAGPARPGVPNAR